MGELSDALRALHELRPHRILVEASGSALPGPLVWEIEKAADVVKVDGVVAVIDCANFARITNFSRTAKIQAKCTDLVLLNKARDLARSPADRPCCSARSPRYFPTFPPHTHASSQRPLKPLRQVELAGEEVLEDVLDDLHELVPDSPKVASPVPTPCPSHLAQPRRAPRPSI